MPLTILTTTGSFCGVTVFSPMSGFSQLECHESSFPLDFGDQSRYSGPLVPALHVFVLIRCLSFTDEV